VKKRNETYKSRLDKLEDIVFEKQRAQTMRILEELTDRACVRLPANMDLTKFIDWLRSLYPELYKSNKSRSTILQI